MEESKEQPKREGLHKYIYVSKLDSYVYINHHYACFC
jgi:hypothetical protein